jgi:hypothetical protein
VAFGKVITRICSESLTLYSTVRLSLSSLLYPIEREYFDAVLLLLARANGFIMAGQASLCSVRRAFAFQSDLQLP